MTTYVRFKYIRRLWMSSYPATVPLSNRRRIEKGPAYNLPTKWVEYCQHINGKREANYLMRPHSGWVNSVSASGIPLAEAVTMGGNIAMVKAYSGGFFLVDALTPTSPLPDQSDLLHVHQFTCLNIWGNPCPPADGTITVWYPFIINAAQAWVHESKVEVFEYLPEPIFPKLLGDFSEPQYNAIARKGTVVRTAPGGNKVRVLLADERVAVIGTARGWSQIGYRRWVETSCLTFL